jgi:Arc/MetJ-type ribon-helix-helix transcriptional regulator
MAITLDPVLEQRIQRQLDRGPYATPAELINRALDVLEAEDWLLENREAINAALDQSFAAKERGEGYSPEESMALLAARRAARAA